MSKKVCLVTGSAGKIGQKVVLNLIAENKKVLALGEPDDVFSPSVLNTNHIKINTALPITSKSFEKHDVQFCFGDLSDISFLASIFSQASQNDIEIEYVIHLSANKDIQSTSPKAYHPAFGDTVNLIEVTRAYWQSNPDTFKGFFFAGDTKNSVNDKIVKMMESIKEKYNFPVEIYTPKESTNTKINSTPISVLYRFITPLKVKSPLPESINFTKTTESKYTTALIGAINHFLEK